MLRCSSCGRRAVYHQRTSGVFLCDRCLIKSVERRFWRTVSKNKLIEPNERIAVAVSGGKDSTTLLHLLAKYCRHQACELVVLSIDEGIEGYRDRSLLLARENAKTLGLEHIVVSFRDAFGAGLDQMTKLAKQKGSLNLCTCCGVLRRSLLNQASRELKADRLATAHNLDDEVQAIMLNYVRGDLSRLHRLGPIYPSKEGFVPRIKPLREIPEKEIALYALLRELKVELTTCPYVGGMRSEIRDFINQLETNHPTTKYMILRMFDRLKPHLAEALPEFKLGRCEVCGEPTPSDVCKACELLGKLGLGRRKEKIIPSCTDYFRRPLPPKIA
ncbi:MAG: TIGR00269 family protein [Candidatus Hadarchaeota archaeon]|nr:TIGR00269 family protein [Candidatus Hadarchaeota archaeon]